MPFEIVRNDIVNMQVDAIVNTANPRPVVGSGTDAAIHAKAGPGLLVARKAVGHIRTGSAAITAGFGLPARYVIHTVGPVWRGGFLGEETQLRRCYDSALKMAAEYRCRSIAFPLISTGNYGFPKDRALQIAISTFSEFLTEHEMQIYLVVFNRDAFRLSEQLFSNVASYIDEHYVAEKVWAEYGALPYRTEPSRILEETSFDLFETVPMASEPEEDMDFPEEASFRSEAPSMALPRPCEATRPSFDMAAPSKSLSLEELLRHTDAGFSETLLKLIDRSGKKDSAIYKKANLSKQHFSKIRNNPDYKPTKATALALALALELNLEETRDLIGRAGYALTNSSKFDLIVRYFIERGIYDVMQINLTLYEFDQNLLGV